MAMNPYKAPNIDSKSDRERTVLDTSELKEKLPGILALGFGTSVCLGVTALIVKSTLIANDSIFEEPAEHIFDISMAISGVISSGLMAVVLASYIYTECSDCLKTVPATHENDSNTDQGLIEKSDQES